MLERPKPSGNDHALLAGVYNRGEPQGPDRNLDELGALVEAAGGFVVGRSYQMRNSGKGAIHPATYLGK